MPVVTHLCSLRWISSTRSCATVGTGHGALAFTGDLPAFQSGAASPLPPFAMYRALPGADYYEGSAPSRRHQRTLRLACPAGRRRGREGFHVHCRSVGGVVASYAPAGLPRRSRSHSSRSHGGRIHAARAGLPGIHRETAHRMAGPYPSGLSRRPHLRGFWHWFTCVTPFRLACRARAVRQSLRVTSSSGPLPPSPTAPGVRLPQLHRAAATAQRVGSHTPPDPTAPRGARTR